MNYKIYQPLLLALMVLLGIVIGYRMNEKDAGPMVTTLSSHNGDYSLGRVEEVLRYIESKYMDHVSSDSLINVAIEAVMNQLDPHSMYLTPSEVTAATESMSGKFKGVGIETLYIDDTVNIVQVLKGLPADKAGVKIFDQIIYIGDSLVAGVGLSFEDIRNMLRGGDGDTQVQVKLKRPGESQLVTKAITLGQIDVNSIDAAFMLDDTIGLIKISNFTENTYKEFMAELEVLHDSLGMKHLIVDVRDNPGGVLTEVTKVINQLIVEKDRLMVYTENKDKKKSEYRTNGKVFFPVDKIVVLVNENSASASEILAGAIQDWDRGPVVGRRTFGKGLVQEQYGLSNGGAIRLTTARYYTPSGRSIQRDYSQRSNYFNEYQNRLDIGNLHHQDTSDQLGPALKTMIYGRDIYGHNGINPDIFVPAQIFSDKELHTLMFDNIYGLAFSILKKNPDINIDNDLSDDNIWSTFVKYIKSDVPKPAPKDLAAFSQKVKNSATYIKMGKTTGYKYELSHDDEVQKALEYIHKNQRLQDLR